LGCSTSPADPGLAGVTTNDIIDAFRGVSQVYERTMIAGVSFIPGVLSAGMRRFGFTQLEVDGFWVGVGVYGIPPVRFANLLSCRSRSLLQKLRQAPDELVHVSDLKSRQPPREMTRSRIDRLAKSMQERGFNVEYPIEIVEYEGKLIIYDGHHRAAAAGRAGIREVPVRRRVVSSEEAKRLYQHFLDSLWDR